MPTTRPKFDLEFGNIAGLDPDRYEPALVHLPQTKDNYRLVGATKQKMSYMGPGQPQSMIDEERTPLQTTRLERGHMQLEPAAPLAPGEYGLVLRPTKADKPKKGMSQSGAEQGVFYSVWDFSVAGQTADACSRKNNRAYVGRTFDFAQDRSAPHTHIGSYRIFFPNADSASSTARSAVRLCSSMTGFTSTISKLSMRPWSAMISMARCASR